MWGYPAVGATRCGHNQAQGRNTGARSVSEPTIRSEAVTSTKLGCTDTDAVAFLEAEVQPDRPRKKEEKKTPKHTPKQETGTNF